MQVLGPLSGSVVRPTAAGLVTCSGDVPPGPMPRWDVAVLVMAGFSPLGALAVLFLRLRRELDYGR